MPATTLTSAPLGCAPSLHQMAVDVAIGIAKRDAAALDMILASPLGLDAVSECMSALVSGKQGNAFMSDVRQALPNVHPTPAIFGRSGGRLAWLIWRGVPAGRPAGAPCSTGSVAIFERLASTGWAPSNIQMKSLIDVAAHTRDCGALVFFAERGWLPPISGSTFMADSRPIRICEAFLAQAEEDLTALGRLIDLGVFVDQDGFVGLMDFAALSLYECADVFDAKKFQPRATAIAHASQQHHGLGRGVGPAALLARLFSGDWWKLISKTNPASWHGSAAKSFEWLAAKAGPLAAATQCSPRLDPFRALARAPARHQSACRGVLACLEAHGASARQSSRYLAEEVAAMDGKSEFFLTMAIDAGAQQCASPTRVFAALAGWRSDYSREAADESHPDPLAGSSQKRAFSPLSGWRDWGVQERACSFAHYFKQLGIEPALVDLGAVATHHPLFVAVARKKFALASLFLDLGMSPFCRTASTGETIFHALALDDSDEAAAFSAKLLAIPGMANLVDLPSHPESESSALPSGRTALMRASGALNHNQVKALLCAGADPNRQDSFGSSPLGYLARKSGSRAVERCTPVVRALLAAGADPSIADFKGIAPAVAMARSGPIDAIAEILGSLPCALDGPSAAKARLCLSARGPQALSIVERATLSGDVEAACSARPRSAPRL